MSPRLTSLQAGWLLAGLHARLAYNRLASASFRRPKPEQRSGTARKRSSSLLVSTLMFLTLTGSAFGQAFVIVRRLEHVLEPAEWGAAMGLVLTLLLVATLSMQVSLEMRALERDEASTDWLLGFPISTRVLVGGQVLRRALVQPFAFLVFFAVLTVIAAYAGWRWGAPVIGLVFTLTVLPMLAVAQVALELAMIRFTRPAVATGLLTATFVVGSSILVFLMAMPQPSPETKWAYRDGEVVEVKLEPEPRWQLELLRAALPATRGLPGAALAEVVTTPPGALSDAARPALRHGLEMLGLAAVAGAGALALTRRGWPRVRTRSARRSVRAGERSRWRGIGLIGKELLLLRRRPSLVMSGLIVPIVFFLLQGALTRDRIGSLLEEPTQLAAWCYGMGAYGCFILSTTMVSSEGPAVWLSYQLPRSMFRLTLTKVWVGTLFAWVMTVGALGLALALSVFGGGWGESHLDLSEFAPEALYAIIGVPLVALVAGAISVLGADPTATDVRHRMRQDYLYLAMVLQGFYAYGFFGGYAGKLTCVVLTAALAFGLWQRAEGRLPYLLDPTAKPPGRLEMADGLVLATFFLIVQLISRLILSVFYRQLDREPGLVALLSFVGAGIATVLGVLVLLLRRRLSLRALVPPHRQGGGLTLSALTLAGVGIAVGYRALLVAFPTIESWLMGETQRLELEGLKWPLVALFLVAAPVLEEIVFRGVLLRGLRQSFPVLGSVVFSAAIFAVVHPPISMIPVFGLGILAALAVEATGALWAGMVVHAAYNGAVLSFDLAS